MKKILVFVFILLGLITSCIPNKRVVLKIGINSWPGYEPLAAANKLKIFEKYGLDVQFFEYTSLSDAKTAFERKQIDVLCSTIVEMITAHDNSKIQMTPLIVSDYSNGPDVIIGKNINSISELKGKKIGLEVGSLGILVLGRALAINGLRLADVELVPLDQSQLIESFSKNKIDAAVSYPPVSIRTLENKEMKQIFSSADIPFEIIDVISINSEVYQNDKTIREKFLNVWDEAISILKNDPEKIIPIMAEREGLSTQEFKESMEGLIFLTKSDQSQMFDNEQRFRKSFNTTVKYLHEMKIIKEVYDYENIIIE